MALCEKWHLPLCSTWAFLERALSRGRLEEMWDVRGERRQGSDDSQVCVREKDNDRVRKRENEMERPERKMSEGDVLLCSTEHPFPTGVTEEVSFPGTKNIHLK